jgi:uncharacterized membrane protein
MTKPPVPGYRAVRAADDGQAWVSAGSRTRLALMFVAGIGASLVVGFAWRWAYAPLVGWDVAALVFVTWVLLATWPMTASATAAHATREDPGVLISDVIVILAAVASLAAIGVVLVQASSASSSKQDLLAGLGLASVVLSWFTVHALFMLRYARLYYTGIDGGVNFNQEAPPRYLDFAYLSFTIGMTFQVSDTDIQRASIRHTALRHALLSYLFGAVILATTINLLAGLGSGSGGG